MIKQQTLLTVGAIVAVVVAAVIVAKKASKAAGEALQAINPLNHDNMAAQAVNSALDAIVPANGVGRNADGSVTLGGAIYDLLNPATANAVRDINKPVTNQPTATPDTAGMWG